VPEAADSAQPKATAQVSCGAHCYAQEREEGEREREREGREREREH